ncbi:hypothetical protein [Acidimangrovimonas pyrenivorans]|uniref:HPt domain-containing protein n=1 Tax=Acidimangrovimonas pyrenivorans TaxID=2030798 RepID=A0ABV7AC68_9RHOB
MSCQPAQLRPCAGPWLDPERLLALREELGPEALEQLLQVTLRDLARLMEGLRAHYAGTAPRAFAADLAALQRLAGHVGMAGLAQAAAAVLLCLDRRDATALAATWARLRRIGERVLAAESDLRSLSV